MNKILIAVGLVIIILLVGIGVIVLTKSASPNQQLVNTINAPQKNLIGIQEKPEDTIKKMTEAYWEAVKFNDYAAAYDFFQPSDKKLITKEDYVKKEKADSLIVISDIKIESVRVEGNTGTVRVILTANTGSWPGTNNFTLIDGKWYKVMSEENKKFLEIGQSQGM